ncbi:cold shock domain-containing protein [Paraburkholderia sediminicola]|uniref:cold-shock protein n=1 Tax=Paraburkholderia sediminicola TaxID=458836 RepID=UPI0038BD09FC
MRGTVKWFSQKRGYGFIVGQDDIEYHVSVRDVSGVTLPANGDTVEFEVTQGTRASRATQVTVLQRAARATQPAQSIGDRVVCEACQKRMVPRLITYRGEPKKSVCPFCGTTYRKFGCFLATAVYGDYDAPKVRLLRDFRDHVLNQSRVGRAMVQLYYRTSPPIADFLRTRPTSAAAVRFALDVLIRFITLINGKAAWTNANRRSDKP